MQNNKRTYTATVAEIVNSIKRIQAVNSEEEMNKPYVDEFITIQQKERDKQITILLSHYVDAYKSKINSSKWYKGILFTICVSILLIFSIMFAYLIYKLSFSADITVNNATESASIGNIVELVSVCVTFLTLIVSILKIITKYVFPEKEEEYITRIVEIIQKNDLENKKENIKAREIVKEHSKQKESQIEEIQTIL